MSLNSTKIKNKLYYETMINDKVEWKKALEYFKFNYGQKVKFNSIFHRIRWLIHHKTPKMYVANSFNDYFIGKVGKLRQEMPTTNSEQLYSPIKKIIKEKHWKI